MNIKAALGGSSSRRASPERGSDDPALPGRAPRRTGSFGKGLGTALANSMTRATEAVGAGKKNSSSATPTPTPGTPGGTPLTSSKEFPFPAPAAPGTAGPDPQHLSNFSLRLSELVNQALAPTAAGAAPPSSSSGMASVAKHASGRSSVPNLNQIVYEGKRLPNRAKIVEFAHLVVSELRYANGVDPYLLRAVSRAALKALTLFANRVDSLLVPVAKDPSSLIMPTTAKEGAHISAALEFNLGLATITWIVEDSLERCIEGDERIGDNGMPAFVSEILTPVRKRMETTILHVIQPVLAGTKASLTGSLLKAVRQPFLAGASPAVTPSASHDGTLPPLSPLATPGSALASPKGPVDGAAPATNWIKELQGRLDGSRKLLVPRIEARTSQDGEGWFISVVVHLIWKGLFILSTRPVEPTAACAGATAKHGMASFLAPSSHQAIADANKRSPSPGQLSAALKSVASVGTGRGRSATPGGATPAAAASGRATPAADGTLSPPTAAGGAPHFKPLLFSPNLKASTSQLADLQAFQKMSLRFCRGFVSDKALAAVAAELSRADIAAEEQQEEEVQEVEDEEDELARQALAEALEAINSTLVVVQAMDLNPAGVRLALERVGGAAHRTVSGSSSHSAAGAAGDARLAPTAAPTTPLGIKPLEPTQLRALKAIPPLLLLHIAYCRLPSTVKTPWTGSGHASSSAYLSHPPALFGISWQEYERSIAGFVGGTSWAQAAVPRWQKEVEALWSEYAGLKQELIAAKRNGKTTGKTTAPAAAVATREGPHHDDKSAGLLDVDANAGIDDFGTTPTPSRLAAAAAAAEQQRRSNEEGAPLSRPTTRSDDGRSGLGLAAAGSGSSAASASSRQSSRVHSPAQSPPLGAVDAHGSDADLDVVEDMEGSIGALSLGSASQQSASATASTTATAAKQPTKRFWKSNSGSSETNGTTTAAAPPTATRTNSSSGRGFHLPSLSRPTFGSRMSSPAGSVRGGSAAAAGGASNAAGSTSRSRSSKREDSAGAAGVYPSSSTHATSSSSLSGAPANAATPQASATSTASATYSTAEDVELADLSRCQEAVAFFAKVLDWAAWSAGLEGSVCQLVPALDGDEHEGRSSSSSSAAAGGVQ